VKAPVLRSYAGQIKIFLVLLVMFLAVAIYCDVHLLVLARNAVQDEAGERLGLEADLARAELERDQMIRGLQAGPGTAPYIPPTYLDHMARIKGLSQIDILASDGRVVSSSAPARVGTTDAWLVADDGRARRLLLSGETAVTPLSRVAGTARASLAAYRPIHDRTRAAVAFIRVEREEPLLAAVDFNLRTIAALQAGGLIFVLGLVILFAQWLLRPYRRLQRAAVEAPISVTPSGPGSTDEADVLVGAFQGVVDKLRDQESELVALKRRVAGPVGSGFTGGGFAAGEAPAGERLLAGMTSAALVFDGEGRLQTLNAAAESLLGIGAASAAGRRYDDLLATHARLVELLRRALEAGEGRSREVVTLRGADGRTGHIGAMLSPIRSVVPATGGRAAGVEGVVCLLTDLTEIRLLRERGRLRENLAGLGELSAGIAHEFRNALAVIQGHARLAEKTAALKGAPSEHATAILREVGRIQAVVTDFLRYARPQTPDLHEIDLDALVREVAEGFRAETRRVAISLRVEGVFPRLCADENLLGQALMNLLRNAAEAIESAAGAANGALAPVASSDGATRGGAAGGGTAPAIVLRGVPEPGERGGVRLEVEDNGPGIPPADLPHVFAPFFTTREEGTGLGLALVQKTAALHDGLAEAENLAGGGTRISLVLPYRPNAAPAADLVA
jgi:PAS domain S-box-containing protein